MEREMSLAEEMAMAAGVESLFRRRNRRTLFGIDRRVVLLAMIMVGAAITTAMAAFQERRGKGRYHPAEYPDLAA